MNTNPLFLSRRDMLKNSTAGFASLAFSALAAQAGSPAQRSVDPLAPRLPHFAARAKRVIFLAMRGAPSQMDTFDYKPKLNADAARPGGRGTLVGSPFRFRQRGQSGLWISDLFPHLSRHADELCLLNSMHTDIPSHPQAFTMMHTGSTNFVRPSLGAWVLYGLGKETEELPGFISLNAPQGAASAFGSAFLPAIYQGTQIGALRETEDAVVSGGMNDLRNPLVNSAIQRQQLDLIQAMNRDLLAASGDSEMEGVIQSYELGFRMQTSVPRAMDLSQESRATLNLYGIGAAPTDHFGRQCLLARRFAEAGVRFIEITHANWDHHYDLRARLAKSCAETDKPIAALVTDLKTRGLFDDTLIVWGGEFGRTPGGRSDDGRDHNARGFTMWMSGGGVKGGMRHGSTDDHGQMAVDKPMHTHDLHATILAVMGLDHERLTYRYAGRDFRLTNVSGNVATEILA